MDSVNVLRYDRWRKLNDHHLPNGNRYDLSKMNSYTIAALKPMLTKDGFLRQSVIGGKEPVRPSKLLIFCAE